MGQTASSTRVASRVELTEEDIRQMLQKLRIDEDGNQQAASYNEADDEIPADLREWVLLQLKTITEDGARPLSDDTTLADMALQKSEEYLQARYKKD